MQSNRKGHAMMNAVLWNGLSHVKCSVMEWVTPKRMQCNGMGQAMINAVQRNGSGHDKYSVIEWVTQ